MKRRFDNLVAATLALLLLVLPGALSARERRGADLVITRTDAQTVSGELIAVKPNSVLLLSPSGKDESVDIVGIKSIRIVRKSRAMSGALYGFLTGAVAGVVLNASIGEYFRGSYLAAGTFYGGIGVIIGLGVGAWAGSDKTIQIEGKSESDRAIALDRLRRLARIRDHK